MTSELTILDEQIAAREAELVEMRERRAVLSFNRHAVGVAAVIAADLGTYAGEILSDSKRPTAVLGRYLLVIAIQQELELPTLQVAKLVQRDHTTLLTMVPQIRRAAETIPQLQHIIERARAEVRKAWGVAKTTTRDTRGTL